MIEQIINQAMRAQRQVVGKQQQAADAVAWCRLRYDILLDFGTYEEVAAAAAALQAARRQQATQHEARPRLLQGRLVEERPTMPDHKTSHPPTLGHEGRGGRTN